MMKNNPALFEITKNRNKKTEASRRATPKIVAMRVLLKNL
jgi:hypothetical protein